MLINRISDYLNMHKKTTLDHKVREILGYPLLVRDLEQLLVAHVALKSRVDAVLMANQDAPIEQENLARMLRSYPTSDQEM